MAQDVPRAPIPLGPDGLWGSRNYATTPLTGLIEATNVTYEGGVISKEPGCAQYSTATGVLATTVAILGGSDWWPTATGQEPVIMTATGTLLRDDGNGTYANTLISGLAHAQVVPQFVECGKERTANARRLVMFTGENAPIVVRGAAAATASAIVTPPADWGAGNWPVFGVLHENRLWAGGNLNNPHSVYYSTASAHEEFVAVDAGQIYVYPGEGQRLIAGCSFKGFLVLWKAPRGIYLIDTRDPIPTNWKVVKQNTHVGIAGPGAWCLIDDDVLFVDTSGQLQALSRVTDETYAARNVSDQMQMRDFITSNIEPTRLWNTRMVYYAYKREVHISFSAPAGTTNNRRLIVDLNRPDVVRFRWNDRDVQEALWLQQDATLIERPMIGAENGIVWQLDATNYSKGATTGYTGSFQTGYTDCSHVDPLLATRNKNGRFLELTYEQVGDYLLYADIYWDEVLVETISFPMGIENTGFTYTFPMVFAQRGKLATVRKRINGEGRRFSVRFRNSNVNEQFKLSTAFLGFMPGTERD